jgi:hypothetical protein
VIHAFHRHKLILLALWLWLALGWSGAHGHFCLDGQEAPVSIHMDVLGDHPNHHEEEQHQDADVPLNQPLLAKLIKIDLPLILSIVIIFALLFFQVSKAFPPCSASYFQDFFRLRPPLRAPPHFPA